MKKILFLLLFTVASYGQAVFDEGIQIKNNTTDNSATKVNVQSTDGTINTIPKADLVNVIEVNDVPSLPLIGEVGKIYVVSNVNKIYRWNGTFYSEIFGAKGDKGDKGDQGIQGVAGLTGLKGDKGDVGLTGSIGLTGAKGDKGDIGLTGVAGTNGLDGAKGDQGIQGIQGLKGDTGAKGDTGSFNGDITADQVTETATRKFQTPTQSAYNDANSPIQGQLNSKENAFSKNTAFNKNFGTTAGTVVEGGTLGSNAYSSTAYLPLSGGTLSGSLRFTDGEGVITPNTLISEINNYAGSTNQFKSSSIKFYTGAYVDQGKITFNTSVDGIDYVRLTLEETGAATFSSTVTATSFNGSATLTGTPTAPTAAAGTNTTQIATTAFVQATTSRPYKVYTALLTQSGTNAPTAVVLENTLGGTVVWSRNSVGAYLGTLANAFVPGKTTVQVTRTNPSFVDFSTNIGGQRFNADSVGITTFSTTAYVDSQLAASTIEIRVYN